MLIISIFSVYYILYMNQFGFRKKYSTFLALMDLVENITNNIDGGNYSIGIFLDLSKAFDTIDHIPYYCIHVNPPSFVRSLRHFGIAENLRPGDENLRHLTVKSRF